MPDLAIRFAVYEPDGARKAILPYPLTATITHPMNDIGGGALDYLSAVDNASAL